MKKIEDRHEDIKQKLLKLRNFDGLVFKPETKNWIANYIADYVLEWEMEKDQQWISCLPENESEDNFPDGANSLSLKSKAMIEGYNLCRQQFLDNARKKGLME